jgi:NAD(P)-dependent dehydrogenase (short-subunit alcohol dehydrogenase family)
METVLITGANRGIGFELTLQYLRKSSRVIATCRAPESAPLLSELKRSYPDTLQVLPLEVTDEQSVQTLVESLRGTTIDVLINNAGVSGGKQQDIRSMDYAWWAHTLAVNAIAPFRVTVALLDNLRRSRKPRIVTLSSQLGSMLRPTTSGFYAYRSSKAAVNKVMQGLAVDLRSENMIVCPVHPGWVQTEMGGANADISPQESASGLIQMIDRLELSDSGRFLKWNGEEHPW